MFPFSIIFTLLSNIKVIIVILGAVGGYFIYNMYMNSPVSETVEKVKKATENFCGGSCSMNNM